jgi:hypothetical protein
MTTSLRPRLSVTSAGKRHYIHVPTGVAGELFTYLRDKRIQVAPPQPCFTDQDSLELGGTVDAAAVQGLLDEWS